MKPSADQKVRIAAIDVRGSGNDGPGIRSIVFFQGCDRAVKCPGCHNPSSHAMDGGKLMCVGDVVARLEVSPLRRVTISGGEPLAQPEALEALLSLLKKDGFDIALYTWRKSGEVPKRILKHLDYLKTGEFQVRLKTSTMPYVGSSNQRFNKVA